MGIRKWCWILVALALGTILGGCANSQQIKVVTDITPNGEVTYHTEYVAEF